MLRENLIRLAEVDVSSLGLAGFVGLLIRWRGEEVIRWCNSGTHLPRPLVIGPLLFTVGRMRVQAGVIGNARLIHQSSQMLP